MCFLFCLFLTIISYIVLGDNVKIIKYVLCISIFFCFINNAYARDIAKSTIVMDIDSGRVLYEKNANEPRLIASITKIMTAVVAIENGNLDKEIVVGEEVSKMYGSNIYIKVGEKLTIRDLLYGLILRSGNDSAVTIAVNVAGSEEKFVSLMNKKAKQLNMKNTIFRNVTGLDDDSQNKSTAYDMALLSRYANTLLDYIEISGTKKYKIQTNYQPYIWNNRNKLLKSYKYATGGKTGYTPKAGHTFVSSASNDNLRLTIVSLDDNNMYLNHEELYDYYFSNYNNELIIDKNNMNFRDNSNCYLKKNFYYPLQKSEINDIKTIVNIYNNKSDICGEVIVYLKDTEIYRDNIYSKNDESNESNIISKMINFITSLFD